MSTAAQEIAAWTAPSFGALRRLLRDPGARVGLVLVTLFLGLAVLGPIIAPQDPLEVTVERLEGPSARHLLGTDGLGRDVLSRILTGARLSLGTALLASVLVTAIGVVVGTLAGFYGGLLDRLLMRVVDVVLAVPGLALALAVTGLFDQSLTAVMLGLVTIWWAGYARVVRGLVLSIRERQFVEAARSAGVTESRIMLRHVLPNAVSPVIVLATLEIGQLILAVSGLTFLGLGAPPPTPEWGAMLNESRIYFLSDPHVVFIPGLTISLAVLGFNLLGDGIRDALDPHQAVPSRRQLARLRMLGRSRPASAAAGPPAVTGTRPSPDRAAG
ncbi:MAG TPA: ABC transporter permease [Acidimicrobiales bacterium]